MGYIGTNGLVVVEDKFSYGTSTPQLDTVIGGSDNILAKNGQKVNGVTTIKFIRPIKASDGVDKEIRTGVNTVYLAYASQTSGLAQHDYRAAIPNVELLKIQTSAIAQPLIIFRFHYIVLASLFILIVLISIISTFLHTIPPFDIILHFRGIPPVINEKIGRFINFIPDLTLGEYFILFCYFIIATSWSIVAGVNGYYYSPSPTNVVSRIFAQLALLNFTFILLPVTRNSIWVYVFGISFERATKYHAKFAVLTIFYVFLHMLFMFIDKGLQIPVIFTLNYTTSIGGNYGIVIFGFISFCCMLCLLLLAIVVEPLIYDLFVVTHRFFAFLSLVFACIHHYHVLLHLGISLLLLFIDHAIRWVKTLIPAKILSVHIVNNVTRLEMSSPFIHNFRPGSYIYLYVPGVSPFEWHPFSLSSNPLNDSFTLHISAQNTLLSWTKKLKEKVEKSNDPQSIFVRVEGPYGIPSIKYDDYSTLILVSGGIGVTTMMSMASYLTQRITGLKKLKKVIFIWTLRDTEILSLFKEDLESIRAHSSFELKIYCSSNDKQSQFTVIKGRPDFEEIFDKQDDKYIGVMACGPETLLNSVQYCVWKKSTISKQFHYHKEVFRIV